MTGLGRYFSDLAFTGAGFVVLDFEGCTPRGCPAEPIEIGVVLLRPDMGGLTCVGRYEALIKPPAHAPLTAAATTLTGITAGMLTDRPAAGPVLAGLDALLTRPPYITVAHHAPVESGILACYAHACPTLAAAPMLDTLLLAKACHPDLPSYGLDALLTLYGITVAGDRHRALADADVTAQLFMALLGDGADRHGWSRLGQLRSFAGRPPPAAGAAQTALF